MLGSQVSGNGSTASTKNGGRLSQMLKGMPSGILPLHNKSEENTSTETCFVEAHWFECLVTFLVLLNAVQIGISLEYPGLAIAGLAVDTVCEHVFTALFFLEMVLKLIFLNRRFADCRWNVFDAFLALTSVIFAWIVPLLLDGVQGRGFQSLRALRMVKILRSRPELEALLDGMAHSFMALRWVALLLGILIYITAIFCMYIVTVDETNEELFGSLAATMWTLCRICMGDIFGDVIGPVVTAHPEMALVFGAFVASSSWGILNLIIGIIIQGTDTAQLALEEERAQMTKKRQEAGLHTFCDKFYDEIAGGAASRDLLESRAQVDDLFKDLDFPKGFLIKDVIDMFDWDASGEVSKAEFISGMHNMIHSSDFKRDCVLQTTQLNIIKSVKALTEKVNHVEHVLCQPKTPPGDSAECGLATRGFPQRLVDASDWDGVAADCQHSLQVCDEDISKALPDDYADQPDDVHCQEVDV